MIGGSVADRDGRIQKGDRVLSINGKGLKGVTHREALAILKVRDRSFGTAHTGTGALERICEKGVIPLPLPFPFE